MELKNEDLLLEIVTDGYVFIAPVNKEPVLVEWPDLSDLDHVTTKSIRELVNSINKHISNMYKRTKKKRIIH